MNKLNETKEKEYNEIINSEKIIEELKEKERQIVIKIVRLDRKSVV